MPHDCISATGSFAKAIDNPLIVSDEIPSFARF